MMEKDIIGSLKPKARCKAISPLSISDGFVRGWAFDPLRSVTKVSLRVDGIEVAGGMADHPVADEFYAYCTPPNANCGFVLALPNEALDGFVHQLSVKVVEWRSVPLSPDVSENWCHGNIFGEVKFTKQGFIEGWVGFRSPIDVNNLPPVTVSQNSQTHYAIQLTRATPTSANQGQWVGKFRVPESQFAALEQPVFSCLGTVLRLERNTTLFKPIGQVEAVDHEGIRGWALNSFNPFESLDLQLVVDGLPLKAIRPNVRRDNIADYLNLLPEEIGMVGFQIGLPAKLKDGRPHTVSVHCRKDGKVLNEKPLDYCHLSYGISLQEAQALLGKTADKVSDSQIISQYPAKSRSSRNTSPKVSVIILNRNGAPCLDALFESWQRYNTTPVELIVIDHASTDSSLETIKQWQDKLPIQALALDNNDSFSASSNRGAKLAKAPFVLFLNNDIVWKQDALPAMLNTLKSRQVGVVGLKLLKTEFSEDSDNASLGSTPEVQHLGVRYTLTGDQYWPYETSPDSNLPEEHYSPQEVMIVTAAVMLCRRDEFLAVGGFDEGYFYGYEDVEFCLRMSAGQGKRIVCRNDLVALHHHGYTRLTGREPSMIDRQSGNQMRLADQLGLWSKRTFWQGLLDPANLLTNEKLTIGFAIQNIHSSQAGKNQLARAADLAERIGTVYPNTNITFLTSEGSWNRVGGLHVLVSLSPYLDLRCLKQARADLRTAFYVAHESELSAWFINPSLELFDACLCIDSELAGKAETSMQHKVRPVTVSDKAPLADLLDAKRLRVLLRVPSNPKLIDAANRLAQAMKAQGALVYILGPETWCEQSRVVEVVINLHGEPTKDTRTLPAYERRHDVINVLWVVEDVDSLHSSELAHADHVWLAVDKLPPHLEKAALEQRSVGLQSESMQGLVQHLQAIVEKKIARTFRTS